MTDPVTPAPAPTPVTPVVAPTTVSSVVTDVETKAESVWTKIGAHPVLVVLVLGIAAVGVLHVLGIF